jgi:hypothetical protein
LKKKRVMIFLSEEKRREDKIREKRRSEKV